MQEVDIILEGGTVLTLDEADRIIPSGSVAIRKDTIVAVGPRADIAGRDRGRTVIEAAGLATSSCPVLSMPTPMRPMTCFRGIADDLELMEWNDTSFPPRRKTWTRSLPTGVACGLRRDDSLRNDNFLRHVHLRGRDGESGKPRRDALPSRGRCLRFPLPQFTDAR